MRITVVCTGNVARSPALAWMLAGKLGRTAQVDSAAVGKNAVPGLKMRRHMRELMEKQGADAARYAQAHRSRLLADVPVPDLYVAVAPVHMHRLEELAPGVPRVLCHPVIPDPGYGDSEAYAGAWMKMTEAVAVLDTWLPAGSIFLWPGL